MGRLTARIARIKKRIGFAVYCFPHGDDDRFVRNVKEIGTIPELVTLEHFQQGVKTGKTPIYHIFMEESGSGFFADHNRLLAYLYFADRYQLAPVVEYTEKFCYAEENAVNRTTNPFEYYFRQPTGIGLEELKEEGLAVRSRKENTSLADQLNDKAGGYARSEKYMREMARISAKYIRLQDSVEEYISSEIRDLIGGRKTLGVHVRGTDFRRNYNGHPIVVRPEEYLDETRKIVENGYDSVFLATDDSSAVGLFRKVFGDKLLYYPDVVRSDGDETVMKSAVKRENHHYKLGLEVLRDMYTLAACEGLIAGLSQVSYASRIQKLSEGKEWQDLRILDKGINHHRAVNCPG